MRKGAWALALLLVAVLGLMAAKVWLTALPPVRNPPVAGTFDAARAKARLAAILGEQRPHPADSEGDDGVRGRLVAQLQAIGLKPIVRDQFACNELYKARGVSCARVRNVIAAIGPASGKAVLLNAHYDSVPVGPGAADDGIGVGTLLEVGSILKRQPLKRPVILLFNEGEELGLIGARAFLADPIAADIDSLVNLEARGVRGPVNMFETSRPNGPALAVFDGAVKRPFANSLATDVYRLLPNYTDVNSFSERGWLTLNLAPMGNETRYHSPGDDVAALDPATLQHMGDQTVALTRALANGAPATTEDGIFMDLAGRTLIVLPLMVGVALLVLLIAGFIMFAARRGALPRSMAVNFGTMVGSAILCWIAFAAIGAARPGMFWRGYPVMAHLATYASIMLVAVALLSTIGRPASVRQLRASFWLFYAGVGAVIGLIAPGGIIFFLFPPLLALAGAIAARWWKRAEALGAALAILFLYLTWGEMLALLEELLNQGPMWVFAPLGSFIILPILIEAKPLLDRVGWRNATALAGILALLGWAAVAAAPAYSADRQQRFVIQFVQDAGSGTARWSILNDGAHVPPAAGLQWTRGTLPLNNQKRWLSPASPEPGLKPPEIQLLSSLQDGEERTLTLRIVANGNERVALIAPEDAKIREAGTGGFIRPIDQTQNGKYWIGCSGRSCDGAVLQLVIGKTAPVHWLLAGSRAGVPEQAAPLLAARGPFARPQYNADESVVLAHGTF